MTTTPTAPDQGAKAQEATMIESTDTTDLRAAWVAKGRPNTMDDPYWASVVAAMAEPRPAYVLPLVVFG